MLDRDRVTGLALLHQAPGDPERLLETLGLVEAVLSGFADDGVCASGGIRSRGSTRCARSPATCAFPSTLFRRPPCHLPASYLQSSSRTPSQLGRFPLE